MHYGSTYFSKEKKKPTLIPKMKDVKIGQRRALSVSDCLKINDLYGCLDDLKMVSLKFTEFFNLELFSYLSSLGTEILHKMPDFRYLIKPLYLEIDKCN